MVEGLAAQELEGLSDAVRAERVLVLRRLVDRLGGHWLNELAAVDARGAAGAEADLQADSTAGWLRARLRMGAAAAAGSLRTARALFAGGPLTQTARALTEGAITPAHATVLAAGTHQLPAHLTTQAEPVLVEAGRPGTLTRPANATDPRSGSQRRADALTELTRRALEAGHLPQTGGVRPQLLVTVDLASLQGRSGLGGDTDSGPLEPEACRRLACDGALTRVLVTRHPNHPDRSTGEQRWPATDPGHGGEERSPTLDPIAPPGLGARLRTAMALLPPVLGGTPTQPLEVGRSSRVVTPPNAPPWPSATAAAASPAATGP